ncbi:hypothetical protein BDB01DRAFT_799172 [Pilobolus umbonatus]|nr:hypothetical protein BDB01DRAFT_799172 [Pilobolus umbonatus]
MKYVAVCKSLYDYQARTEDELSINEDDILYIVDKEDSDWWKAELKQTETPGPIGLVPASYLEEVVPMGTVRAEYEYTAQQEEELSFEEGDILEVLEKEDPDWFLVRAQNGMIGLAPSNYVVDEEDVMHIPPTIPDVVTPSTVTPPTVTPTVVTPKTVHSTPNADDALTWSVHEYDTAKKKKKKEKGNLSVGNGMLCYGSETDKASPVQQYPILDVIKCLYDNKNLHIEIEGVKKAVLDYQTSSKSEAKAIVAKIEESRKVAQSSATQVKPIVSAQPAVTPPVSAPPAVTTEEESTCVPQWGYSIYKFDPEGGDELPVEMNEPLYVLDYARPDGWIRVQKQNGEVGIVPSSYVKMNDDEDQGDNEEELREQERIEAERQEAERRRQERIEQERRDQQRRQEEERQLQEEEERRYLEEEENRNREENRKREEEERERRRQIQEANKKTELARQKQIEEDYRRKDVERKAAMARSNSTARSGQLTRSGSTAKHQEPPKPKPDLSKVRTWTDRSGTFKVDAQFIDLHNNKLRLHKLNGVKIDVPVEKMCPEDIVWVSEHMKESAPSPQPAPKKFNEAWDWFDWFMLAGIPMQASIQYTSAFKAEKLDDSDIPHLTHKQMKTLGLKEEHVQAVERFIETGRPTDPTDDIPVLALKNKSQVEKDEELARKLQNEWNSSESKAIKTPGAARPRPSKETSSSNNLMGVHPDILELLGNNKSTVESPSTGQDLLNAFNDDAWTPRSEPIVPQKQAAQNAGPTPEEKEAAEAERKKRLEEEQIQKIQLMKLQKETEEQKKQLEEIQALTKQQLELQKQIAMQTGTQQQQQQQQLQQVILQQQRLQQELPPQLQMQFQQSPFQSPGRQRPVPPNRVDKSLSQWSTSTPPAWNSQALQPQMTGFQSDYPSSTGMNTGMGHMSTGMGNMSTGMGSMNTGMNTPMNNMNTPMNNMNTPMNGMHSMNSMSSMTVPVSSILPQPLVPQPAAGQTGMNQRMMSQPTGRHWNSATPDNPFGSPAITPQMTGVQFSTPNNTAFNQSPIQSYPSHLQPQMTGMPNQPMQPQVTGHTIFTPQGSLQYGQSAFSHERPW